MGAQSHQAGLNGERSIADQKKSVLEELFSSEWQLLQRADALPPKREAIEKLIEALRVQHVEQSESFAAGLHAVLKLDAGRRGAFATSLLEFGDAAFRKHISHYTGIISDFQAISAKAREAVTLAEEELAAADQAQGLVVDAQIVAENALMEASEKHRQAKNALREAEINARKADVDLAAAKAELESVKDLRVGKQAETPFESAELESAS